MSCDDGKRTPTWAAIALLLAGAVLLLQQSEIRQIRRDVETIDSRQWVLDQRQGHVEQELDGGILEMKRATHGLIEALRDFLTDKGKELPDDRTGAAGSDNPSPGGGIATIHRQGPD